MAKKPFPLVEAKITAFNHDGRGVTRINGKVVFVEQALPDETVVVKTIKKHKRYNQGICEQVIEASPYRVEPECPHFDLCGACVLQHFASQQQILAKQQVLLENLQHIGKVTATGLLEPLVANAWGYRRKARLGVKYVEKKQRLLIGFREKHTPYLADLKQCLVLEPKVGQQLTLLQQTFNQLTIKRQIPQLEIAVGEQTTAIVIRVLALPTDTDKAILKQLAQQQNYTIYFQTGGTDTIQSLEPKPAPLFYSLAEQQLRFYFRPLDFFQVHANLNQKMISQACQLLRLQASDKVLDLFCGLGNFSLALAQLAGEVIGVEGEQSLVVQARLNADYNRLSNTKFFYSNLHQSFRHEAWSQQTFDKALVDPPRTGAELAIHYLGQQQIRMILYISCNPATLARDADILVHQYAYELELAGVMDMFPQTAHVESIALFRKK